MRRISVKSAKMYINPSTAKNSADNKACFAVLVVALEDQVQVKYICCSHIYPQPGPHMPKKTSETVTLKFTKSSPIIFLLTAITRSFSTPCRALWGRMSACCKFEKDIWVHQSKHGAQQFPTGCGHTDSMVASTGRCLEQLNKLTSSPCSLALSSLGTVVHTGAEFLHWS